MRAAERGPGELAPDAEYLLTIQTTTGGSAVGVPVTSLVPFNGSLWVLAGETVQLQATADPGYGFVGWQGTGNGSYSGADTTPTSL